MKGIVLSINKEKNEIVLLEEMEKKKVSLERGEIKKVMRWDKVIIKEGKVILERRAKPISVSKACKLIKFIEEGIITTIYGRAENGFLYDLNSMEKIKILSKNFIEGEVVIENAIINKEGISLSFKSRVFRKSSN